MESRNRRGSASDVITGGVLGACRGAFFGAVLGPFVFTALWAILWPGFQSDENFWVASLLGVPIGGLVGGLVGMLDQWRRPRSITGPGVLIHVSGLLLVLILGVPCTGFWGAVAGILYWTACFGLLHARPSGPQWAPMPRRPDPEHREGIQVGKSAGGSGTYPPELGLPRLDQLPDEAGQGFLSILWKVLKVDLAVCAGVLVGVALGGFVGGVLDMLFGNGFYLLRWVIGGSVAGGIACAALLAILAWKALP